MDEKRFDALTRMLGAARTRRGAIGTLAALFGGAAAVGLDDADARNRGRRRRRRCKPKCGAGQTCNRDTRTCSCDNGGTVCGSNCCLPGTRCESGQCFPLTPQPTCHAFGDECAGDNIPCCGADLQCGSGQGGKRDVACYKKIDVACTADTECIYGTRCSGGTCKLIQPPPVPTCTTSNCNGCCTGNVCIAGNQTSSNLCGTGGNACVTCGVGTECVAGVCTPPAEPACSAANCAGCCDGDACILPGTQTDLVCGTGVAGAACAACGAGTECSAGACVPIVPPACTEASCADGCCDGTTCVRFDAQTPGQCGSLGNACGICTTGASCVNGECVVIPTCADCADGCCDGTTCVPFAEQNATQCGSAGNACVACASGATCSSGACAFV